MVAKMRFLQSGVRLLGAVGVAATGIRLDPAKRADDDYSLLPVCPFLHDHQSVPFHAPREKWRSQPETARIPDVRIKAALSCIRTLDRTRIEQGIPGVCVSVSVNGRSLVNAGMGFSDVENGVQCSSKTTMRIASISKPLTAVALMQLWQKKKVDLDAPIQRYVPSFPKKTFSGKPVEITTRQLLSHISGIRHYRNTSGGKEGEKEEARTRMKNMKEYYITEHYDSITESLQLFAKDDLLAEPGTKFNYTTHGWTLVSAVVEAASGMDFLSYMKSHIFRPLGMTSTGPEHHQPLHYNRARYYCRSDKGLLQNTPHIDNSYKWAGGGFVGTAEDLVKFGNALLISYNHWQRQQRKEREEEEEKEDHVKDGASLKSDVHSCETVPATVTSAQKDEKEQESSDGHGHRFLLDPATVAMMWQPVVRVSSIEGGDVREGVSYGMGWFVEEGEEGIIGGQKKLMSVCHTGGAVGASSVLTIIPGNGGGAGQCHPDGVVVAVLFNLQEVSGLHELGKKLAEEVYRSLCEEEEQQSRVDPVTTIIA